MTQTLKLKRHRHTPLYRQGRQQFWIERQPYVGVTSVLRATRTPKPSLLAWQAKVGPEAAAEAKRQGIERGKLLHKLVQGKLMGQASHGAEVAALKPEMQDYWQSLQPILAAVGEPILIESTVWHPYGYAGVVDALVEYEGRLCVCEWKSATKQKQVGWIEEECLQVAAYAAAINRVYQGEGVRVARGLVVFALPEGEAQVFEIGKEEMFEHWQAFQKRLEQFYPQIEVG